MKFAGRNRSLSRTSFRTFRRIRQYQMRKSIQRPPSACPPTETFIMKPPPACKMNLLLPARRKRKDTATIVPAHAVGIGSVFKKLHPDIFSFHKRKIHLYVPGSPVRQPGHIPGISWRRAMTIYSPTFPSSGNVSCHVVGIPAINRVHSASLM